MKRQIVILTILIAASCQPNKVGNESIVAREDYPTNVGDITFDKNTDDPDFTVCDESHIAQYYGVRSEYNGEKFAILNHFNSNYDKSGLEDENGYLTIRFIVNCKGKTGHFRIEGMNPNYEPITINKKLTEQLLQLIKEMDGWKIAHYKNQPRDYYKYLTFKILNGKLAEILP
ncbi:hypothetical protein JYT59_00150 [Sphingobacteriaceae bacterium AH-315-L07]|nr:hypothetical protein [Sphingobacteriaceae bacterium AH-315-L07]